MLQTVEQLMHGLEAALGRDAVTADPSALDMHRIDGTTPRLVVTPLSADQVGATLRLSTGARATVIPWGGGTTLALGNPPRQADVVIKLHKLDRVIEHDSANLTVSAQCGMTLHALQSAIAAQSQFVPIDAPSPEQATLGGIVAANLNGPRRAGYGSVRDLVIGMKVRLADGGQIKAGGKVVKNVAGYDMCKLFVGSLGTLGIITEVTLRVAPVPEQAVTFVCSGDLAQLENFHQELLRSILAPAAVFLSLDTAPVIPRVAVWCEGFDDGVKRQLGQLDAMATARGIERDILTAEEHTAFWKPLRDFSLQANGLIYRVTVPPAAVFKIVKLIDGWHRHSTTIIADTAMGTIWLACAAHKSALERFSQLITMAREHRGHAIVFAAPPGLKTGINVWGASPPTLSLMRGIKQQFDPHALLNPGRFVGNL